MTRDPLDLARELVSVPSVNPSLAEGGGGEAAIAELTAGWLAGWGFDTSVAEVAPGRLNVVGTLGSGTGPAVLLNGHLDTVGVEGMTIEPFAGTVRDGRLLGRGACDMKGGVAALLAAAAALAEEADRLRGTLTVALTADEEHASLGMQALVDGGARADAAVVCEPTSLTVMPAHKGFVWLDVLFRGRAAHGSRPERGVDAVRHAGHFLVALEALAGTLAARTPHPLLGSGSFHAGTIRGGTAPSVYPDRCTLTLERRTLPGESAEAVAAEFREVLERLALDVLDLDAELVPGLARPGTEVSPDAPVVTGLLAAARAEGLESTVAGMTAWVEAAFLNEAGVPAVCFGPGSIEQAHAEDEWCDVDEIRACARVLRRWAAGLLIDGERRSPAPS